MKIVAAEKKTGNAPGEVLRPHLVQTHKEDGRMAQAVRRGQRRLGYVHSVFAV
jgi:hypothetical protein